MKQCLDDNGIQYTNSRYVVSYKLKESIKMQTTSKHPNAQPSSTAVSRSHARLQLKGASVLVIGGSGGIGSALVDRLSLLGAARIVVASARKPIPQPNNPRLIAETADVTDKGSLIALVDRLRVYDISLVVNCAGVNGNCRLYEEQSENMARREIEVNYFGLMNVAAAFAPLLVARGGGTIMTMLSFLSHMNLPTMASYCASKAAAHSLTQALRAEWSKQGVHFCGVYPTAVDTRMSANQQGPKQSPHELAAEMLEGVARGDEDVFPGSAGEAYKEMLRDPKSLECAMASVLR